MEKIKSNQRVYLVLHRKNISNFASNQITFLASQIGVLTDLTSLKLDQNNLTALPTELAQLGSLTKLHVFQNNIIGQRLELNVDTITDCKAQEDDVDEKNCFSACVPDICCPSSKRCPSTRC